MLHALPLTAWSMKKQHNTQKISIRLSDAECATLRKITTSGTQNARAIMRAHILLLSHNGKTNRETVDMLGCSPRSISDIRRRYVDRASIGEVINDAPRPGQPKKITPEHEAFVVATACTSAPEGHGHWTLEALKAALIGAYADVRSVSHERIRQVLIHSALKPWREKNVVRAEAHV
jgi:transposase